VGVWGIAHLSISARLSPAVAPSFLSPCIQNLDPLVNHPSPAFRLPCGHKVDPTALVVAPADSLPICWHIVPSLHQYFLGAESGAAGSRDHRIHHERTFATWHPLWTATEQLGQEPHTTTPGTHTWVLLQTTDHCDNAVTAEVHAPTAVTSLHLGDNEERHTRHRLVGNKATDGRRHAQGRTSSTRTHCHAPKRDGIPNPNEPQRAAEDASRAMAGSQAERDIELNILNFKEDYSLANGESYLTQEPTYEMPRRLSRAGPDRWRRWVDSFRRDPHSRMTPKNAFTANPAWPGIGHSASPAGPDDDDDDDDDDDHGRSHGHGHHPGRNYYDVRAANYRTAHSLLARELKGRHLQMIAIGGSIGKWHLRLPVFCDSSVGLPCAWARVGARPKCQRPTRGLTFLVGFRLRRRARPRLSRYLGNRPGIFSRPCAQ
jgi:hypothetical protein